MLKESHRLSYQNAVYEREEIFKIYKIGFTSFMQQAKVDMQYGKS